MIHTYVLIAMLILGWGQAQDSHADEPVKIYEDLVSVPLDPEAFRGYLRHPAFFEEVPEAIVISIVCYTDGNGKLAVLSPWADFISTLTYDGKYLINKYMVELGSYACTQALEVWNATDIIDESKPVWHL